MRLNLNNMQKMRVKLKLNKKWLQTCTALLINYSIYFYHLVINYENCTSKLGCNNWDGFYLWYWWWHDLNEFCNLFDYLFESWTIVPSTPASREASILKWLSQITPSPTRMDWSVGLTRASISTLSSVKKYQRLMHSPKRTPPSVWATAPPKKGRLWRNWKRSSWRLGKTRTLI